MFLVRFAENRVLRKMGPLAADHPLIENRRCPACGHAFEGGQYVTLVPLGPGDDEEARARAMAGRVYNAVAAPVHWACTTGEDA